VHFLSGGVLHFGAVAALCPVEDRVEPNLLDEWSSFASRIRGASRVGVFCDYEGTLVPRSEGDRRLPLAEEVREALQRLAALRKVTVGVLSGRPVAELRSLAPIEGAWYSGLHGHEIRSPQGLERRWFTRKEARRIAVLADRIERELSGVPGVRVERKGGALSVRHREAPPERTREIQESVLKLWRTEGKGLRLWPGIGEMEILASENRVKGTAVRFILGKVAARTYPVYFGDDETDLEAFRALRYSGVRIAVGDVASPHLDYRVPGPPAVAAALRRSAEFLEKWAR
jgi:alpha,alpha-trehalase